MNAHWPDPRPAADGDWPAIEALLREAGLPTSDLDAGALGRFMVAGRDGRIEGCAALDVAGRDGLLRSLAVAPAARGQGVGAALVAAIEAQARQRKLAALYLLTPTASRFFAGLGYRLVAGLPKALALHPQATGLCPGAHRMGKALAEPIEAGTRQVVASAPRCADGTCAPQSKRQSSRCN